MNCEQLTLTGDPREMASRLRALVPAPESVRDAVARIVARVRAGGDAAVDELTRSFDTAGADPGPLVVGEGELDAAADGLERAVRAGLERAIENVRRVCGESVTPDRAVDLGAHEVVLREAPLGRAGIYVPGGRAPYPSTVVMGVVPALVAGVRRVAVCSPPGRDGEIDRVVLGACRLAGAAVVYRMGGAQAIAALAFGTESVDAVDVIAGPGNLYVQEAKRQVSGHVAIDGFAGPSDLVLLADAGAEPEPLALDLLAQAEHGAGTLVIAISSSPDLLGALAGRLGEARDTGAVARLVAVADDEQALALASALAPEHLQLVGARAEALAARITTAGCVFVGAAAGTAFGDYIAGSNHILPTGGAARFASALTPADFRRRFTEVRVGARAAAELARVAAPVARAEGFDMHARSMEARIRDNGRDAP
jgi:histidinol dehydrogenase